MHVREGDTCSIKIEASKDDVSQMTSPHTNGKPGTNGLKGREKTETNHSEVRIPGVKDLLFEKVYIII